MKFLVIAFYSFTVLCLSACKKQNEDQCGSLGGIVSPNRYLFWMNYNPSCGYITVEVKDANGKVILPYQGKITQTASAPPECNNENFGKYATFSLYQGKTYTYKATCTGRTWSGTIAVPCEQNQCKNIQLQ